MRATARQIIGTALAAGIVVVVVAGILAAISSRPGRMQITADFPSSPGLYKGNHVEVLGVPVGTVTAIDPKAGYVAVHMSVDRNVAIPAEADALLEAPDVVNDRFVELNPAYTGGPRLQAHAVIPTGRTAVPVSTDEIIQNLDQVVNDLGPNGANRNGAVESALAQLARILAGNGANLNRTITSTGQAVSALGGTAPQLENLLTQLATFSETAASDSGQYQVFATDLGAVSTELAADDQDLGSALHNLQQAFGALATFLQTNRNGLGDTVTKLDTVFATLAREQTQLEGLLNIAPTAVSNLNNAIDPNAPGGPALVSRYDPTTGSQIVTNQVCGSTTLRLLITTVQNPTKPTPLDVVCGFSSLIQNLGTPPGAPSGGDESLANLAGAGS